MVPPTPELYTYYHPLPLHDSLPFYTISAGTEAACDELDAQARRIAIEVGAAAIGALRIGKLGIGIGRRQRARRFTAHACATGERQRPREDEAPGDEMLMVRTRPHLAAPCLDHRNRNATSGRFDPSSRRCPYLLPVQRA